MGMMRADRGIAVQVRRLERHHRSRPRDRADRPVLLEQRASELPLAESHANRGELMAAADTLAAKVHNVQRGAWHRALDSRAELRPTQRTEAQLRAWADAKRSQLSARQDAVQIDPTDIVPRNVGMDLPGLHD